MAGSGVREPGRALPSGGGCAEPRGVEPSCSAARPARPPPQPAQVTAAEGIGATGVHRFCGATISIPSEAGGTPVVPGDLRLCSASLGKWDSIHSQRG